MQFYFETEYVLTHDCNYLNSKISSEIPLKFPYYRQSHVIITEF